MPSIVIRVAMHGFNILPSIALGQYFNLIGQTYDRFCLCPNFIDEMHIFSLNCLDPNLFTLS